MTKTNELVCLNKASHYLDTALFREFRKKKKNVEGDFCNSTLSLRAGV